MNCSIKSIDKKQLYLIKELWEKLRLLHLFDSNNFKEYFQNFTFEDRCEKFKLIDSDNILIEVLFDGTDAVGYCISTNEKEKGEIESLYIEEIYRNRGFGRTFIQNGIKWLKAKNAKKIMLAVAEGHDQVLDFYKSCGFFHRFTYLQFKDL
jgi:diamine N-acetyltransferase